LCHDYKHTCKDHSTFRALETVFVPRLQTHMQRYMFSHSESNSFMWQQNSRTSFRLMIHTAGLTCCLTLKCLASVCLGSLCPGVGLCLGLCSRGLWSGAYVRGLMSQGFSPKELCSWGLIIGGLSAGRGILL